MSQKNIGAIMVVGGGIAGMTAAIALSDQGFETHLVEKNDCLGGQALNLHKTWKGEDIAKKLAELVSEKTGYPQDVLDLELDLEADLGIDTVKQVEIFGSLAGKFGFTVPDDLRLRDLNTIAKLGAYIADKTGEPAAPAPAAAPAAPAPAPQTARLLSSPPSTPAANTRLIFRARLFIK